MLESFHHYNSDSSFSSSSSSDNNFLISDLLIPLHKEEKIKKKSIYSNICCFYSYFQRCKKG